MDNALLLITAIISSGGLGFINFYILRKLNRISINSKDKDEKKIILLLFSSINYLIYLVVAFFLKSIISDEIGLAAVSFTLTIIITIFLSLFIFPHIIYALSWITNKLRRQDGKNDISSETVHDKFFQNYSNNKNMYIFNLEGHLIFKGTPYQFSLSTDENFEFLATYFYEESVTKDYDELVEYARLKNIDIDILVNIDKKIKIVIFP